jgi:large subunit ribosomal protein L7/L12
VEGTNYSEKTGQLLKTFESMTLLELKEFKEAFELKFDVKAAAPMAGMMMAAPGAAAAVEEEKPTTVSLILKGAGDKKIQVIKVVREVTSLGLKEAKDLVDAAPKPIKEGMTPEEAQKLKEKFDAAGAEMEIK